MAFNSWEDFRTFTQDVRFHSRYVHSANTETFLRNIKETLPSKERSCEAGKVLFRSQIGHVERECEGQYVIEGHPPSRMKPLERKSHEGRANPKGISYLYLSNDEKTSMAELRPHAGQHISCAQFKVIRNLRLIDCYSSNKQFSHVGCIFNPPQSQEEIADAIWSQINDCFTNPATNNYSSSEYVPTQILAEQFKIEGYDGICCKSHLGLGHNFILFNLELANLINCTVMETKSVDFDFHECANRYHVK